MATRVYPGNQPMAFRVYGPVPGDWAGSLDTLRPELSCNHSYMASLTKEEAGEKDTITGTIFNINQQGDYDTVLRQWNLGPLTAQTIDGTFDLCMCHRTRWLEPLNVTDESVVRYKVHIAIMAGQTNTVRHVLLDNLVDVNDLNRDVGAGLGTWQSLDTPAALSAGDTEEGDYIRIVVGYRIVSSPTPTPLYPSEPFNVDAYSTEIIMYSGFGATNSSGVAQTDAIAGEDTSIPGNGGVERAAWMEFSDGITFLSEGLTPPANDACADAIEITDFPYRSDAIDTRASTFTERGVWYHFTAPRTGTVILFALGSTYAVQFFVLSGADCGTAGGVGGSGDSALRNGRSFSMRQFNVTEGTHYFVNPRNRAIQSANSSGSGGLLQFYMFYQETPQEDDLYLPAGSLISWRLNEDTMELWPVMFSFNMEGAGSALTGIDIDYTGRQIIDNYGAGDPHTGHRILMSFHADDYTSIIDVNSFLELDFIDDNYDPPLLRMHPAQMAITEAGHLYQAFFGNGYLWIEGEGDVPSTLNAVSDVADYSAIRSLEAIDGDSQGAVTAALITPDLGDQTPSAWALTYQESSGAIFFTMGSVYHESVGSQQVRKYLGGVTTVFATLPATNGTGLRGLEALPDGTILVCNGTRAHRLDADGNIIVNYIPASRPENFEVCADIKSTADGTRVWVVSFDYAALALFDIDTGEEIAVYDTWQKPIALVQMAIYQAEGVTIPPTEPPEEPPAIPEDCPAEIVIEPPPRTALERFFRVHGPKERAASEATADAQFGDFAAALGDTSFGQLPLGASGVRRRPGLGIP